MGKFDKTTAAMIFICSSYIAIVSQGFGKFLWGFLGVGLACFFLALDKPSGSARLIRSTFTMIFTWAIAIASWIPVIVLVYFQLLPIWVVDFMFIWPFFLFIGLDYKGMDFLRARFGVKPITSKRTRLLLGIGWSIMSSFIGVLCGVISVFAALLGYSVGVLGGQAPPGYVWISTGTPTPAIAYVIGLGCLVFGFLSGFYIFSQASRWIEKITLRTIGTDRPLFFGAITLIITAVVTVEEIVFKFPIFGPILNSFPPFW